MQEIKLKAISISEVKSKLDAEYTESIDLSEWFNLGNGSLRFIESGKQVIDGVISGIKPKPLTLEVEVVTRKRGRKMPSKAQLKRASVRGKIIMLDIFGEGCGKLVRLKRPSYDDICHAFRENRTQWPKKTSCRRALVILDGVKTPVRIKGKR